MNKNLFIISSILLTAFLFSAGVVFSQETAVEETVIASEVSEEVKIDITVQPEDLEVTKVGILPDSPLYIFKKIGRALSQTFTFNPVSKAELKLKFANEKIMEAQQLIEKKGTEKAISIAQNIIDEANRDFESIANQGEQLKESRVTEAPRIEKFLDKVADHSLKHQTVLQKLQEQVPEEVFVKIEAARQQHLENFAAVMTKVAENPQEVTERLPRIIEAQKGSDFKEIKAVAILEELKEKAPEETKAALKTAQKTVVQKLEQRISKIPEEVRQEKLSNYVESLPGNPIRQFEALDVIKQTLKSSEIISETEILKDKTVKKFEEQFGQTQNEEIRSQLLAPLQNGDARDLRTVTEMEMRMTPLPTEEAGPLPTIYQTIKEVRQETQQKLQERIIKEPQILNRDETLKRMVTTPDVVDLKVSQELNQIFITPQAGQTVPLPAKNVIKNFDNQVTNKFVKNIEQIQAKVSSGAVPSTEVNKFIPSVPQGLEILQELKEKVAPEAQKGIEQAIKVQTQVIQQKAQKIEEIQKQEQEKMMKPIQPMPEILPSNR